MKYVEAADFLSLSDNIPHVDVRSPSEFAQGHIPGATNIPLFTDEERAEVGTLFKNLGKEESVKKGLELVGPKMRDLVEQVQNIAPGREVLVHCWRGGMRSESMAWLFETAGLSCRVLIGGYKAYRNHIRKNLLMGKQLIVLGGLTGSGKTILLKKIKELGEPVVDLEGIANHRGSAFGGIGMEDQPTTEQFENNLFFEVSGVNQPYFWVEDESLRIGKVFIPESLHNEMLNSGILFIDVPDEYRLDILLGEYSEQDAAQLEQSILRIEPRLGGLAAKQACDALKSGDFRETARILLKYYDKTYMFGLSKKNPENVHRLNLRTEPVEQYPELIIEQKQILLSKNKPVAQ